MPWLTPIVFRQAQDEALSRLPRFGEGPSRVRFRHIVHPYNDVAVPENTAILPITFESIERARQFAEPECRVTCVAVTFPEDIELIPAGVVKGSTLRRDVAQAQSVIAAYAREPKKTQRLKDFIYAHEAEDYRNTVRGASCGDPAAPVN